MSAVGGAALFSALTTLNGCLGVFLNFILGPLIFTSPEYTYPMIYLCPTAATAPRSGYLSKGNFSKFLSYKYFFSILTVETL